MERSARDQAADLFYILCVPLKVRAGDSVGGDPYRRQHQNLRRVRRPYLECDGVDFFRDQSLAQIRPRGFRILRADDMTQWIVLLAILLVWQVACVTVVSARVLPAPSDVAGGKLRQAGEFGKNTWVSFWRARAGFAICGGIGLPSDLRTDSPNSATG
jgi:hypothetical protein